MTRLSKFKPDSSRKRLPAVSKERRSATGEALVRAMQAVPHRDANIESRREPMPVRDVSRRVQAFLCIASSRPAVWQCMRSLLKRSSETRHCSMSHAITSSAGVRVGRAKRQRGTSNGAKLWIVLGLRSLPSSPSPAKRVHDSGSPLHLLAFYRLKSAGESIKRSEPDCRGARSDQRGWFSIT
jgi:hypothetical protein